MVHIAADLDKVKRYFSKQGLWWKDFLNLSESDDISAKVDEKRAELFLYDRTHDTLSYFVKEKCWLGAYKDSKIPSEDGADSGDVIVYMLTSDGHEVESLQAFSGRRKDLRETMFRYVNEALGQKVYEKSSEYAVSQINTSRLEKLLEKQLTQN